jgi:hypothetical protein
MAEITPLLAKMLISPAISVTLATARQHSKEITPKKIKDEDITNFDFWVASLGLLKSFPKKTEPSQRIVFGDIGLEDLAARSMIIIYQYSVLLCTGQEYESRRYLIDIVSSSGKIIRNCDHSLSFDRHLLRETLVDLVALSSWRDFPGRHLPWRFHKGFCVRRGSDSAKVLRLLIYRSLRHICQLLESIRRDYYPKTKTRLIDTTLAIHRFERSLLWETTCEIPDPHGEGLHKLSNYEYSGQMVYARPGGNGKLYATREEMERVFKGQEAHASMVKSSVELITNASNKMLKLHEELKALDDYQVVMTSEEITPEELRVGLGGEVVDLFRKKLFILLIQKFSICARVCREEKDNQKRHLYKYAVGVENMCALMVSYHYHHSKDFPSDCGSVNEVRADLVKKLFDRVDDETIIRVSARDVLSLR